MVGHGRVAHAHISRDWDRVLRLSASVGSEEDLRATDVELWVRRILICLVQCQKGRTDEIVTTGEVFRNSDGEMTVVGDKLLGAPFSGGRIVVISVNAEPSISDCLVLDGRVHFLHVDLAWPLVALVNGARLRAVGPKAIFEGQFRTCLGTTDSSDAVLAIDT